MSAIFPRFLYWLGFPPGIWSRQVDFFPIVTNRLILRRLKDDDLPAFEAYRSDPEVARFQSWSSPEQEPIAFIRQQQGAQFAAAGHWFQIAIALRDSNLLIGDIGVCVRAGEPKSAEIGFTLSREYQGRGLATEAVRRVMKLVFEHADVERIEAVTDTRNIPSIRLLGRLGMHVEKAERTFFKGEPCDESTFVISRREWLDQDGCD